ncbi:PilT/PilU family type 4a pilus ATPase [bacterium]|nr:PilT/PilU family type 4a pilus ATPase [candidate division CSSED10-310 bacterium]
MAKIDSFLKLVLEQQASDLYIIAGAPPMIRFNGDLIPIRFRTLSETESKKFLYEILQPAQRERFQKIRDLDFPYELENVGRFRANIFMDSRGMGGVFRIIPAKVKSIEELGLPTSLKKFSYLDNGLVLVTGPSGCGKTTTLAAIIRELNHKRKKHIITIEDPIEYIHPNVNCVLSQREVGSHTETFQSALRSALRESPDVILVGELRDIETISLAMTCAETGTLIYGTLHTQSASKTVDRIIDVFPKDAQEQIRTMLSITLKGVISQQLVKMADRTGRIAAVEILMGSTALGNLIREGKTYQINTLLQATESEKTGMQSMDKALLKMLKEERILAEDALMMAFDKSLFAQYMGKK